MSMRNVDAECRLDVTTAYVVDDMGAEEQGMTAGKMRRAQLVTPFGVGAMSVLVDGTSVITAGLDHWFPTRQPGSRSRGLPRARLAPRSTAGCQGVPAASGLPNWRPATTTATPS